MDPAESMSHDKDTTFAFMRGAQALGHACLHCLPRQIGHVGRELFADARPISVSEQAPHVSLGAPETVQLAQLDAGAGSLGPSLDTRGPGLSGFREPEPRTRPK